MRKFASIIVTLSVFLGLSLFPGVSTPLSDCKDQLGTWRDVLLVSSAHAACMAMSYTGDAFNFYNVETRAIITDHSHACSSNSSRCKQPNPGTCGFSGASACKTYFMPASAGSMSGSCTCGCG